jgi:RNA polymerase sigma factor (sigma-70 family)
MTAEAPSSAAQPTRDGRAVTDLVVRARDGDQEAWNAVVERYAPLIWSICRKHLAGDAEAKDVSQRVWLRLVEQLHGLRDPAALPGWLVTVTRRECVQARRAARGPNGVVYRLDDETIADDQAVTTEQGLLVAERHAALREAFQSLSPHGRELITLLLQDPPLTYVEISAQLGMPIGSIGPKRRRYLEQLRRHPALAALIDADR